VTLTLATPGGALDPKGFTSVDLVLHAPSGDVWLSSSVAKTEMSTGAAFSGIDLAPGTKVSIEATLRNDTGVAVGYGRTAVDAALLDEATIEVPVRRPIAYIAGAVSRDATGPRRRRRSPTWRPARGSTARPRSARRRCS
jgi:hypothetical protein